MKTTKKHFELFKKECEKWIDFFGLKDWQISISHREIDSDARCGFNINQMDAEIILSTNLKHCDVTEERIKIDAFHEVCHLLLADIDNLSLNFFSNEYVDDKIHSIIRRLQNSVFKTFSKKQ